MLTRLCNIYYRLLGIALRFFLRICGCRAGRGLKCKSWPLFRQIPHGNMVIGDHVTIGWRIAFDICPDAVLRIGNRVNLTQDIVLGAAKHIEIGDDSLLAEFVSLRDNDHGLGADQCIARQEPVSEPIVIGRDVWIAAGARVLRGGRIADGCVIAANAVFTRKTESVDYGIYGGIPARCLGSRTGRKF
ncbi:MAG: acyltransferase [Victivallaceae bacterium]